MTPEPTWNVPLEAGAWAVALVLLGALLAAAALTPVLRRRKEDPVPCCAPGSLGRHPLEDPDKAGVRRCACGVVTSLPAPDARPPLELVDRTDTREHRWPTAELPVTAGRRLRLAEHPFPLPRDDDPTDELPLPHVVWSQP